MTTKNLKKKSENEIFCECFEFIDDMIYQACNRPTPNGFIDLYNDAQELMYFLSRLKNEKT